MMVREGNAGLKSYLFVHVYQPLLIKNYAGIGLSALETFPVGVALPLWDSIVRCQEAPPSSWPQAAYDLIGS